MIDPKKISPLLTNMTVEKEIGRGPNGTVYLVTRGVDGRKLALKHISIPTNDAQTKALIFAGAVSGENDAQRYYSALEKEIKAEILMLNGIKNAPNLLKIRGYQVDRKITGVGCDIYILSDYCISLPNFLHNHYITRLQAINLAIDLCSALEQLRESGLVHKDVRPSNIFMNGSHRFMLGDLGLVKLSDLEYASMPDQLITDYTAPEVVSPDAGLSDRMDIYSVGMILYEIYNGGELPLDDEGAFRRTDAELPAPKFADMPLSEIILRACAFDPENRYDSPSEMKAALVLYLQRGNISNDPLDPTVSQTEADTAVDVAAIAAAVTAGQAAEGMDLSAVTPEDESSADSEQPSEEELEDTQRRVSLNDLDDDELLFPADEEISVEDFLASVRGTPGLEVVSMDAEGNTEMVPGYETEEMLPDDTVYVDSADVHVSDIPPEMPVPDLADTDIPEPAASSAPAEEPKSQPQPEQNLRPRRKPVMIPNNDTGAYDDGYESGEEYLGGDAEEKQGSAWKKVLISVIVLLVLAGGAFTLYTFKTDTVTSMSAQALSSSSILVEAELKNASGVDVVCSNAAGEVARLPYTAGGVTFSDLSPSSDYSFALESTAGKFLLGSKRTSQKTNQMTNLTGFAATSYSAVSATLSLAGNGPEPDGWTVTLTADGKEPLVQETTGFEFLVDGLTPATTYTATIARSDGDNLSGTTSCTFTTMDYTKLSSFEITDLDTDNVSVEWAYTGTVPESWTVSYEDDDGNTGSQDVDGSSTSCTLDGLTSGVTYKLILSCASLEETEADTISVGMPVVTVTNMSSTQNENGDIEVSWEFTGEAPAQWSIAYSYESEYETSPAMVTSDTASVVLSNLLPNANYTIELVYADNLGVGGNAETTCVTAAASPYSKYGCSNPTLTLYVQEDNPDNLETPSSTFTVDQQIAFAIEVSYDETEEEKSAQTLYVIRDSAGVPVFVYTSSREWPGNWLTVKHTGNLPEMPQTPGRYTFEIYYDGAFFASAEFTVQ